MLLCFVRPDTGDCSTSKKACKNCSCGRAEKEAAGERVQLTQEMLDNPKSSCGSVSAACFFRPPEGGCGHKGLNLFLNEVKAVLGDSEEDI